MAIGPVSSFHFDVRLDGLSFARGLAGIHVLARAFARHLNATEGQNGGDEHQG